MDKPWYYVTSDGRLPMPVAAGDGKPFAPIYYRFEALIREYLLTIDEGSSDEKYGDYRWLAEVELEPFFEWLVTNRKLD